MITKKIKEDKIIQVIEVMDIFYQANKLKPRVDRLHNSEFYNDEINNCFNLDVEAFLFY